MAFRAGEGVALEAKEPHLGYLHQDHLCIAMQRENHLKGSLAAQGRSLQAKIKQRRAGFTETFEIGWTAFVPNQHATGEAHLQAAIRVVHAPMPGEHVTDFAYHRPPRDVLMPRALTASAIC
jgi:hypothetical protein